MSLKDKIVVVTGGTDGIGKVTARELATLGAHVTIIGRNAAKGDTVLRELRAQTGNEHVDFLLADLSTRRGVLQAGSALNERFGHIDVLVNNAGAMFQSRQLSADGIEMTLALNHLGYFHAGRAPGKHPPHGPPRPPARRRNNTAAGGTALPGPSPPLRQLPCR